MISCSNYACSFSPKHFVPFCPYSNFRITSCQLTHIVFPFCLPLSLLSFPLSEKVLIFSIKASYVGNSSPTNRHCHCMEQSTTMSNMKKEPYVCKMWKDSRISEKTRVCGVRYRRIYSSTINHSVSDLHPSPVEMVSPPSPGSGHRPRCGSRFPTQNLVRPNQRCSGQLDHRLCHRASSVLPDAVSAYFHKTRWLRSFCSRQPVWRPTNVVEVWHCLWSVSDSVLRFVPVRVGGC